MAADASAATKITKPILMCFICKLSFGNTKSFGLHANTEHTLNLQECEKNLLNREYSSAIIQRNIDEKPQISFLQPLDMQKLQQKQQKCIENDGQSQLNTSFISTSSTESTDERRNSITGSTKIASIATKTSTTTSTTPPNTNSSAIDMKQQFGNDWQQQLKSNSPQLLSDSTNNLANSINANLSGNCSNSVGIANSPASVNSKLLTDLINQQQQQHNANLQRDRMTPTSLLATLHQQQQQQLQLQQAVAAQSGCPDHPIAKGIDCKTCELLECSFYGMGTDSLRLPRTPSKSPTTSTSPQDTLPLTISPTNQPAPSFTIGACPEHVNGRPFGIDCAR